MPKFEVMTQVNVVMVVEAETEKAAIERAEHFAGTWAEPTYDQLIDYNCEHDPIDQVQDWDAVISTADRIADTCTKCGADLDAPSSAGAEDGICGECAG